MHASWYTCRESELLWVNSDVCKQAHAHSMPKYLSSGETGIVQNYGGEYSQCEMHMPHGGNAMKSRIMHKMHKMKCECREMLLNAMKCNKCNEMQ